MLDKDCGYAIITLVTQSFDFLFDQPEEKSMNDKYSGKPIYTGESNAIGIQGGDGKRKMMTKDSGDSGRGARTPSA